MQVKAIIRRQFKQEHTEELLALFYDFRAHAMKQPGYISAEILIAHEDPKQVLVIATWQSISDWHKWKESKIRKEFEAMLEVYQAGPAQYEEFVVAEYPLNLK